MKLYTEDQVRDLLRQVWTYTPTQIDNLIDIMEPIELPSDKEIKDASIKYYVNKSACFYFEIGAKYLRDKIQGGNNEQR
jgi:hypothetical protein